MASSSKPKRKRKRHSSNSEDDPLWTKRSDGDYYSASSDKKKKLTALSSYIPRETSDWTMSELENLQINWNWIDPSTKSIDEFFDMFSNINAVLPPLDADLIKMMDYLNANLTFDTSVKELEQLENHVKVIEYLVKNFLPKVDADSDEHHDDEELMKTVGSSSRVMIHHIEAGRHDFQNDLKEILRDLLLTSRTVEEMRFTTMLEKFCRMCNLKGSIGLVEETMIKDVRVVAVPDLTFIISSNEMLDVTDVTQIQIMTVAEVKVSTNDSLVDQKIHDTRQKPEAIDKETLQTMDPSKIRGFSQHVGQLIIGLGNSCFIKQCLGLLLHETKILITCLSTSPRYCNHIKDKLGPEDKATLHFIGPYDILKARERSQLIKAFLRLGNRQRLGISKV
ncbi:uncharacterized protein LOC143052359 isoform X1 [Mytilus galloprovincialis]|uniref:uncharacterized protein LOC143052359 isoform X1 n=1 Tax=Mytilus galloprovincialis TaxID=29158 RepID=UPI003F7B4ED5